MDIVTDIDYLHKPCEEVKENDPIGDIVEGLFRELTAHQGLGLAANQLRIPLRIFVMINPPQPPVCMVNPALTKTKGSSLNEEGCLSLPGIVRLLRRPFEVVVKGVNQYWKPARWHLTGMKARVACHETDHLCGRLIIDYEEVNHGHNA